ncbi:leucine-rich repeat domain-containing protein [Lactiplantibacillus pingfangensis]|uniref:leucine-rich repeat domain-containing protein n=1 Tax=Lactiplantibacillus pingfangensis TaxID=2559915 RepID=UPI0010F7B63E|nr:hypothetical protein [Lactiplantibacillus pingfangensis]
MISLTMPLQAISSPVIAAATSSTSAESIDTWMPDKSLQQLVLHALNSTSESVNDHGSSGITSVDQITQTMLLDIKYFIPSADDAALVAKVTNLTGLEYATNLENIDLTGATIETAPGDWSVLSKVGSKLGTIDATSSTIDLKDLAKLPLASVQYTLKNGDDIGMPNMLSTGGATSVTQLTPKTNITYDSDPSAMKAYIPLSDWYKGFVTTSGDPEYEYPNMVTYTTTLPTGVTLDMTNHRFVVDLNTWGGKELKIPSFQIKDWTGTAAYADSTPHYYSNGNTLDATVPMPAAPTDVSQTATVADLTNPTGTIDTTNFGFGSATSADLTIKSGDLTADDITFSPDLAENKINFTLTASGVKKLMAGDLKSVITISAGDKIVNLTLTIEENPATWMPDATLRDEITKDLVDAKIGDGTLTKTNLAKLKQATNITGVSNLTGLEYATDLDSLTMTNCKLADLKTSNSQVLPKMTNLQNLEIDDSDLGGSLADWGLKDVTNLSSLTAKNDKLTNPAVTEYANDANLSVLKLSGNELPDDLSQFPVANWPKMKDLELDSNQLTGTIPADWADLTNLSILNLGSNQLTGTLDNIAQLANLTEVHLDKNKNGFSGSIPAAWFTSKLLYLDVNTNQLSGKLPTTISSATSLKTLNVEANQFTGNLPDLSADKALSALRYGTNHITSGSALATSNGNYQTWSIDNPDWQTSSDGKKMTLDLSQYYGGEQGQTGYQYLGIDLPNSESGVTLDKSDSQHPLLTIDTTNTTVTDKGFDVNLVDQAGQQAVFTDSMNYLATIHIPVTLAIPKTYAIETNDVDFGSHVLGSGLVNATGNAFKLTVHSTNAAGDAYQLTAQSAGMTANGQTLPLYYYNGQHNVLLSDVAQAIYNYQPTTADDTTVVGDSSDTTKGNLRTDIGATLHTGQYTGQVTYTLASAPADATPAKSSDMSQVTADTVSQLSPTISADSLSVTQAATRTKLATNMTNFVQNQLADSDGVLYFSYEAGHATDAKGTRKETTETGGLWLLSLAMSGDETTFNTAFKGITTRFYDSDTQTFNWQSLGDAHTITKDSASVDDLRIIQALMIMNQKHPDNDRTAWLNRLIDGFTKYDLNAYYQMIDGYSSSGGQEKQIRLDYLDLSTLKAVYEAKGLGAAGDTAYNQQLKLIKDSYISDKLPLFATYYNYSTGDYQVNGDTAGQINITDGLLTMLNLAKVGELPTTSLNWLKAHTADRSIYNEYNITDGTPVDKNDAASNYAYVAQIAAATGDAELYNQALTVMKSMTSDDDNTASHLDPSDPLYGSAQYEGESYAFNDLNMLLAYTSVFGSN